MSEVVTTAGRRMSLALARALDDVTGSERRAAIVAFTAAAGTVSGRRGALYLALAMELRLCEVREHGTLRELGAQFGDGWDGWDGWEAS